MKHWMKIKSICILKIPHYHLSNMVRIFRTMHLEFMQSIIIQSYIISHLLIIYQTQYCAYFIIIYIMNRSIIYVVLCILWNITFSIPIHRMMRKHIFIHFNQFQPYELIKWRLTCMHAQSCFVISFQMNKLNFITLLNLIGIQYLQNQWIKYSLYKFYSF